MRAPCSALLSTLLLCAAPGPARADAQRVRAWLQQAGSDSFMPADMSRGRAALLEDPRGSLAGLIDLLPLSEWNGNARFFGCEMLSALAEEGVVEGDPLWARVLELEPLLGHAEWTVRSACGEAWGRALGQFRAPERAYTSLELLLYADDNCAVRVNVARGAAGLDHRPWQSMHEPLLTRGQDCQQRTAAYLLAGSSAGQERIGPVLAALARDEAENWQVRDVAVIALGRLGWAGAHETLVALIRQEPDAPGNVKALACGALGELGTLDDIPLLEWVITTDQYGPDGARGHRAQEAIGRIRARLGGG